MYLTRWFNTCKVAAAELSVLKIFILVVFGSGSRGGSSNVPCREATAHRPQTVIPQTV
jgi:hypothetical protein